MSEHTNGVVDEWLIEHGAALYRYALLQLRDPHKAEDMVQETLLAALPAQAGFSGGAMLRTWLFGILKHKIIDQFRRDAREVSLDEPEVVADSDALDEDNFIAAGRWCNRPGAGAIPNRCWQAASFGKSSSCVWTICQSGRRGRLALR